MSRLSKLQQLSRALSPNKVDFSGIDDEVNALKKKLEEKVNIQTIDDVSRQLKLFQKRLDFTPIITAVNTQREEVQAKLAELETKIVAKGQEVFSASEAGDEKLAKQLSTEIATLRSEQQAVETAHQEIIANLGDKMAAFQTLSDSATAKIGELSAELATRSTKKSLEEAVVSFNGGIETLRTDLLKRMSSLGGGSINRQTFVGGTDALTKYSDINWKAGSNVTLTVANNNTTKKAEITIASSGGGGGSGIVRSIVSISADTTAGASAGTDYTYLCSGTLTLTMPDATTNTNLYTVKNVGTGTVTINTTAAQTIDGSATIVMPVRYTSVDLISDTAGWNVT